MQMQQQIHGGGREDASVPAVPLRHRLVPPVDQQRVEDEHRRDGRGPQLRRGTHDPFDNGFVISGS